MSKSITGIAAVCGVIAALASHQAAAAWTGHGGQAAHASCGGTPCGGREVSSGGVSPAAGETTTPTAFPRPGIGAIFDVIRIAASNVVVTLS